MYIIYKHISVAAMVLLKFVAGCYFNWFIFLQCTLSWDSWTHTLPVAAPGTSTRVAKLCNAVEQLELYNKYRLCIGFDDFSPMGLSLALSLNYICHMNLKWRAILLPYQFWQMVVSSMNEQTGFSWWANIFIESSQRHSNFQLCWLHLRPRPKKKLLLCNLYYVN